MTARQTPPSRSPAGGLARQSDPDGTGPTQPASPTWGTGTDPLAPREPGAVERALRALRNRFWVFLAVVLAAAGAALAFSLLQEEDYTATSTVLLRPPAPDASGVPRPEDMDRVVATARDLAALSGVAGRASALLGGDPTPGEVADAIDVESTGQTDVIAFDATTGSPGEAARIANAYARAYTRVPGSLGVGRAQLVERAQAPREGSPRHVERNLAIGVGVGAILGFLLASLLERVDRRLKGVEEFEEIYELPVLARIPRSKLLSARAQRKTPDEALSEASGFSEEAEAFRTLRANLRYFDVDQRARSILVVSPLPGDGKSTTARYLAITMATMGDRVVLVDADLRKRDPTASGADLRAHGLSLVLAGFDLDEALTEVQVAFDPVSEASRSLVKLPSGPLPPNPSELLESSRMRSVIQELEGRFDTVIIDSPALVSVSDATSLVSSVSGVVIVSSLNQTTRNAALGMRKQLALLGARSLGIVANFWTSTGDDYYYGYGRSAGARR